MQCRFVALLFWERRWGQRRTAFGSQLVCWWLQTLRASPRRSSLAAIWGRRKAERRGREKEWEGRYAFPGTDPHTSAVFGAKRDSESRGAVTTVNSLVWVNCQLSSDYSPERSYRVIAKRSDSFHTCQDSILSWDCSPYPRLSMGTQGCQSGFRKPVTYVTSWDWWHCSQTKVTTIFLTVTRKWPFTNDSSGLVVKKNHNSAQPDSCHFCFNDRKWLAAFFGSQQTGNCGKRGIMKVFSPVGC